MGAASERADTTMSEEHHHARPAGVDDMTILRAFHGHLGPYVVAGLRMGRLALRKLEAEPHWGIQCQVHCPDHTPQSCSIDGIQFATGCTMGKRNIHFVVDDSGVWAEFATPNNGKRVTLRLRPEAIAKAVAVMDASTDVAGAKVLDEMADDELIEDVTGA